MGNTHSFWVIYHRAKDYEAEYVARRWLMPGARPTEDIETGETLEEIRAKLPADLVRFDRDSRDDEVIVETWL